MEKNIKKKIEDEYGFIINNVFCNYFFYNDEKVVIINCNLDDDRLEKISTFCNYMFYNGLKINTFLLTKDGKISCNINDNDKIVLLKINDREEKIYINDIKKIRSDSCIYKINLKKIWMETVDKIEEFINNNDLIVDGITRKNREVYYYIGLAENAISLISLYNKNTNTNVEDNEICHDLKIYNYIKEEYNNPLNFFSSNYLYDLATYIKYNYIKQNICYDEIDEILSKIYDKNDQIYFYAVMLYPNYYFDCLLNGYNNEIIKINKRIEEYCELLKYCYKIFKKNEIINNINWLNK